MPVETRARRALKQRGIVFKEEPAVGLPVAEPPKEPELWERALYFGSKGLEYLLSPFTELGIMRKEMGKPWYMPTTEAPPAEFYTPEAMKSRLPGGEAYEEYKKLPIVEQLKWEFPAWVSVAGIPSATAVRGALLQAAAKPGIAAVAPKVARAALAPVEYAIEKPLAIGIKYGIGLPLKYGVAKPVELAARKTFEKALDTGLDKWLLRQGLRGDQANKVLRFFLERNNRWLFERAEANWLRRLAEKKGVKYAATKAASDTVKEAETLLLQASKEVGVRPPVKPPVRPVVPPERPPVKPEVPEFAYEAREIYEMQAELAGLKEWLSTDPIALARFTVGGKRVDLTHFISLRERAYPDYFTVKEAKALFPGHDFTDLTVKGRVPRDAALDDLTKRFNMTPDEIADRVMQITATKKRVKALEGTLARAEVVPEVVKPPVVPEKPPVDRRLEIQKLLLEPAKDLPKDVTKIALRKELRELSAKLVPQEKKLRQQIMAQAKTKGLPESQYRKLFMTKGGSRHLTNITLEKLQRVLEAVKVARPVSLRGKKVIKPDTEELIQAHKAELIDEGILTEETYRDILKALKLPTDKYVSRDLFISQSDGRTIIREMGKKAILAPLGDLKFGKPTAVKYLTSQTYYAQVLGVKPLVEPLELAKVDFDSAYRAMSNAIDGQIGKVNKAWRRELRDLLDKFEEAPPELTAKQTKVFNWFRNLNRTIIDGENQVRRALDMPEIAYREAYVRHVPDAMAEEILRGMHPLPPSLEYWSRRIVSKKVFNPMEFHRQLSDDLAKLYTKDLAHASKNMVYTGLKEIHFAQPLKAFTERLGALSDVMPASTRGWVIDYVNQTLKGQPTRWDAEVNRLVTDSGFGGLMNDILRPYRLSLGMQPVTRLAQQIGRFTILAVLGLPRPRLGRLLIRNLFQRTQELALHGVIPTLKSFAPASGKLKAHIENSSFIKGYTGVEEWPTDLMGKLERTVLAPYQTTAVINARAGKKAAYYDIIPLIANARYKDLVGSTGKKWASPQRTYTEPKDFLYPEEEILLEQETTLAARATQYQYIGLGMPEIFRNKTLIPLTRLQSWWMNHIFMFNREAAHRLLYGETMSGLPLPWSRRINYLKYLLLGGAILTSMGYGMSYLWRVLPHNLSPVGQFMIGLVTYVSAGTDWEREKGKKEIFSSWKAMVPGPLAYDEFTKVWSGEMPLWQIFFYGREEEEMPPRPPTWGIINRQPAINLKVAKKDIAEATGLLGQTVPKEMPEPYHYIDPATGEYRLYTYPEEEYVYTMVDLGAAIRRATLKFEDGDITQEKGFSDLTIMYKQAERTWDTYYYPLPASDRTPFRENPTNISAWTEAYLYVWGKLTVLRNPNSQAIVDQLMREYNIPSEAIRALEEKEGAVKPESRARRALRERGILGQ